LKSNNHPSNQIKKLRSVHKDTKPPEDPMPSCATPFPFFHRTLDERNMFYLEKMQHDEVVIYMFFVPQKELGTNVAIAAPKNSWEYVHHSFGHGLTWSKYIV